MTLPSRIAALSLAITFAAAHDARAGFIGQTLLGPIGPDSVVNGDTHGATDDNDGFSSGGHFFDIWTGPDDVWQLNWPGGDMGLNMTYDIFEGDLDLFLYEPGSLDDSSNYSIINTGLEHISAHDAPAGTYYVVVDGAFGDAAAYTLSVTPEPTTIALLAIGAGIILLARKRSA